MEIIAAQQIDCILVPALEPFATGDIALVRDVLIEVDVFLQVACEMKARCANP